MIKLKTNAVRAIGLSLITLFSSIVPLSANAEAGVIVLMTRKCFVISASSGYVIVDGWVSAAVQLLFCKSSQAIPLG